MCTPGCRNGSCKQTSTVYGLTYTPGRFFHHVASMFSQLLPIFFFLLCPHISHQQSLGSVTVHRFCHTQQTEDTFLSAGLGADVDSQVVRTNYDEYAMMLLLSTEKPSGNKTTIVKLYSERPSKCSFSFVYACNAKWDV